MRAEFNKNKAKNNTLSKFTQGIFYLYNNFISERNSWELPW